MRRTPGKASLTKSLLIRRRRSGLQSLEKHAQIVCRNGAHAGKTGVQAHPEHAERTLPHRFEVCQAQLVDEAVPGMHAHDGFGISQ